MARRHERPSIELRGAKRRAAAVLVLNGATAAELDRARDMVDRIADRRLLVAVDGGLATCIARRRTPDLFVGDLDSCADPPHDLPSVVYPREKDFSDLVGALGEMRRRRIPIIVVAGLLGGRLDHEWANLFELGARAKPFAGILAPTDRGTVVITGRGCRVSTRSGRTFSLLCLGGACTVTLRGARWTLSRRRLRPGSQGLSNVTRGGRLDLTVHSGCAGLVLP